MPRAGPEEMLGHRLKRTVGLEEPAVSGMKKASSSCHLRSSESGTACSASLILRKEGRHLRPTPDETLLHLQEKLRRESSVLTFASVLRFWCRGPRLSCWFEGFQAEGAPLPPAGPHSQRPPAYSAL